MKINFHYIVLGFVIISFILSSYFYPISRDEFYYIDQSFSENIFLEYYNSYFLGNPRIGQFFSNLLGRHLYFDLFVSFAIFIGLFYLSYLIIYRSKLNFMNKENVSKFLIFLAFYIICINYFGEMFLYVPYSTNYTLTTILYLIYYYFFIEYLVYKNNKLNKIHLLPIFFLGLFTGMGNEHVPPTLLLLGFCGGIYSLIKYKKLLCNKFIFYNISIFIGYLLLFFAPANTIRYKTLNKTPFSFSLEEYFKGFIRISKLYFYYNQILSIALLASLVIFLLLILKNKVSKTFITSRLILFFGLITIPLIAYSPIVGTRLLFFGNTLLIIFSFSVFHEAFSRIKNMKKTALSLGYVFLILFFTVSLLITINGNKNFNEVLQNIENKSKISKNVVLENSFNYEIPYFGKFNRMILIENGTEYIDNNPEKDHSTEKILKNIFKINSLSIKKNETQNNH